MPSLFASCGGLVLASRPGGSGLCRSSGTSYPCTMKRYSYVVQYTGGSELLLTKGHLWRGRSKHGVWFNTGRILINTNCKILRIERTPVQDYVPKTSICERASQPNAPKTQAKRTESAKCEPTVSARTPTSHACEHAHQSCNFARSVWLMPKFARPNKMRVTWNDTHVPNSQTSRRAHVSLQLTR
jgi:hypothetical protein